MGIIQMIIQLEADSKYAVRDFIVPLPNLEECKAKVPA